MWARLLAVAAGLWLMASPAVLDYGSPAATSDRIAGPIGAAFAFVALWAITRVLRWVQVPLGLWLVAAPLVLGHPSDAAASSVVAGLVFLGTAFVGESAADQFGGGWASLTQPLPGRGARPDFPEG